MWTKIAHFLIKYRWVSVSILGVVTLFMGWHARKAAISYEFYNFVPDTHPDMVYFEAFLEQYGQDDNLFVIGTSDSSLYTPETFARYRYMADELEKLGGVIRAVSLANIQELYKDTAQDNFRLRPVFQVLPKTQPELDSLLTKAKDQRLFSSQILNPENGATITVVSIEKEILNSKARNALIDDIVLAANQFAEATEVTIFFAGLPFLRSIMTTKVQAELQLFIILSIVVTGIILLAFFRSFRAVLFPMVIIGIVIVWIFGTIVLFGFSVTILTALIPPVIVVIGIPNSVYLLNRYHQLYHRHGNKVKAISEVIRKIGLVTLITNATTAIGFLVLLSTDIMPLREFGIVAGINIMATFVVSMVIVPAVFSWMPEPNPRQLKHLRFKMLNGVLEFLELFVRKYRIVVYLSNAAIIVICIIGVTRLKSVAYLTDDLPESSGLTDDLVWFEDNFEGIMPLELVVDTGKPRGLLRSVNQRKLSELETFIEELPHISSPISAIGVIKAIRQAFYNGNPFYYDLPNSRDRAFIQRYFDLNQDQTGLLSSIVDSSFQTMRISLKVADIGSIRMDSLLNEAIQPKIDSLFADTDVTVTPTGTTLLFIKGNKFMIENLRVSLLLAFAIIAVIMGFLFRNTRMIFISIIPNLIPLLITAGLMGYLGIPLKPSTALIFSIAFGISVDDSIHFLAKYRQELFAHNFKVKPAVSKTIIETGSSMMYTSIILFAGFVIFSFSEFGGTVSLGILTSTTLLIAMITNLVLLPTLILDFDSGKRKTNIHPIIEDYDDQAFIDKQLEEGEENVEAREEVFQSAEKEA
ncbi:MAG TPA: hypothetical protein DCE41_30505 [Cytophagales bacterium]|nr:hypothetical protein [Cytophagales bacterium]HAA19136.1 hypothetical protein [Cytophagales bacterium]HAP62705.1 hypothetical protein [Cytophagales bacterium]